MIICYVHWKDDNSQDQREEVYSVSAAKKFMKEHPSATATKVKVYSNGDWINCGEITLKGSNKSFIANSPKNMKNSNY